MWRDIFSSAGLFALTCTPFLRHGSSGITVLPTVQPFEIRKLHVGRGKRIVSVYPHGKHAVPRFMEALSHSTDVNFRFSQLNNVQSHFKCLFAMPNLKSAHRRDSSQCCNFMGLRAGTFSCHRGEWREIWRFLFFSHFWLWTRNFTCSLSGRADLDPTSWNLSILAQIGIFKKEHVWFGWLIF